MNEGALFRRMPRARVSMLDRARIRRNYHEGFVRAQLHVLLGDNTEVAAVLAEELLMVVMSAHRLEGRPEAALALLERECNRIWLITQCDPNTPLAAEARLGLELGLEEARLLFDDLPLEAVVTVHPVFIGFRAQTPLWPHMVPAAA
jgi:hypothetical protein